MLASALGAALWFCAICAFVPAAAAAKEVQVLGDHSFYPYEYCTFLSGHAHGILVEQWQLMAKRAGIRMAYSCEDWDVAQKRVLEGKADALGGMIRSARREQSYTFIRPLVPNPPEYLYWDSEKYTKEPSVGALTVQQTPIGVVKGDYAVKWLEQHSPGANLAQYASYEDLVRAAIDGHLNVFVMEEAIAKHYLEEFRAGERFSLSLSPSSMNGFGPRFAKTTAPCRMN